MTKTRQSVIFVALAVLLAMAAGWFLLVSPQRSKAADLRAQTATVQSRSATLRTDLDVLTAQSKRLPVKQAELAKFARQIPSTPALPAMIRVLQQAATSAGVALVSIAPQPPAPFVVGVSPTGPGAAAGAPPAAPSAAGAPTALQSIVLTTKVTGSYVQLEQFVANLEGLPRLFLVSGYTMAPTTMTKPGSAAPKCTATACLLDLEVTGQVFIAPALVAPPAPASGR